ncbi:AcrB/AcrD/AcrF family protein [Corallincola holothuriorum]|uniref:AcrB/AcrD/AcrF family protein n=1 Tax=Corallincola holothuriorum TaxID=2282215 RepID=A0A368NJX6_9GAMM|nr:efflux RND transporter permease subunit [Corallincola holothuriorum]RCU50907.1 AcrB/AcrD/AcrF family protein [Corallincola holothuriorum]
MVLTSSSLKNPAGVLIMVAMVALLGLYSLHQLPVQLFPSIERPQISVMTSWRAASPREIESEILEPQEEVLQGLPGVEEMSAWANRGTSWINLTFGLETDMQKTLIEVIARMNRLPLMPRDSDPPTIMLGGWGGDTPALTYFFIQALPENEHPVSDYLTFFEDVVRPRLESVPGVSRARLESGGGSPEELQVRFDPFLAADLGIDLSAIGSLLGSGNDISGGFVDVGRRQYTLRFAGRYQPEQLGELILEWRDGRPVYLRDIAEITVKRGDRQGLAIQNGNPAISVRIDRQSGANVLATLSLVKAEVEKLRQTVLAEKQLTMEQSFDASIFILRAINLLTGNLSIGILLAIGVLWWFMRQTRATLLVALAIPISLLSTFVVLKLTGRSLNVISLAGLAFAVGMVLDAAIVVLENIVRHRQQGETGLRAAEVGATEVWGALLASTATTVAIFIPVIFLKDVEGQLFADLALTIAIAVSISLLVAVTILPAAASRWLVRDAIPDRLAGLWLRITERIMRLTASAKRRWLLIVSMMTVPIAVTVLMLPSIDYLPPVKRDAVDAWFNFPPGASIDTLDKEIVQTIVQRLDPYMKGEQQPALKNYYIILWPNGGTMGVRVKEQEQVGEMETLMREQILVGLPDTMAFARQGNLFGGFGGGRHIAVHLKSRDTDALLQVARFGVERLNEVMPEANVRPNPGLEMAEPELRVVPNDRRMLEVGWDRSDLGRLIRSFGDGLYVGEYFDGDKRMNIIFRSDQWQSPEQLSAMPLATPQGGQVTLGELVDIERTVGPSQVQRIDRRRTITLGVTPPEGMTLQQAIDLIKTEVEPQLQARMPADGAIGYGGSADSLKSALSNMAENFVVALLLLFLLMAGLFRSAKDSLLVVLSIPLATVGGVLALRLLHLVSFQPLDLLTMIGFVILLGLVVNNAILLVHQTRSAERHGEDRAEAVRQALLLRMRPIFMSTLTSIFGMLPLVLMPGTGSVIYRGLATVIVGGMSVSTLFTLLLLPALLRLGEGQQRQAEVVDMPERFPMASGNKGNRS